MNTIKKQPFGVVYRNMDPREKVFPAISFGIYSLLSREAQL